MVLDHLTELSVESLAESLLYLVDQLARARVNLDSMSLTRTQEEDAQARLLLLNSQTTILCEGFYALNLELQLKSSGLGTLKKKRKKLLSNLRKSTKTTPPHSSLESEKR